MDIDTTTSSGRLIYSIFAGLAEFDRDLIRERTSAGLTAACAEGRVGGRAARRTYHGVIEQGQQSRSEASQGHIQSLKSPMAMEVSFDSGVLRARQERFSTRRRPAGCAQETAVCMKGTDIHIQRLGPNNAERRGNENARAGRGYPLLQSKTTTLSPYSVLAAQDPEASGRWPSSIQALTDVGASRISSPVR